jgi:hypothetical protein
MTIRRFGHLSSTFIVSDQVATRRERLRRIAHPRCAVQAPAGTSEDVDTTPAASPSPQHLRSARKPWSTNAVRRLYSGHIRDKPQQLNPLVRLAGRIGEITRMRIDPRDVTAILGTPRSSGTRPVNPPPR